MSSATVIVFPGKIVIEIIKERRFSSNCSDASRVRRLVLKFGMETDGQDPLFRDFLKDFGLEYLNANERASLRSYLTRLGRKWAEIEATTTTIELEDHAVFSRALDAEPTDDLVALLKLHDPRRAIRTAETPGDLRSLLHEALDQPYEP